MHEEAPLRQRLHARTLREGIALRRVRAGDAAMRLALATARRRAAFGVPRILSTEFDIASRLSSRSSRHALRAFHSLAKGTHLNGDTFPEPFPRCASKKHRARLRSSTAPPFASFPMAETWRQAHKANDSSPHEDVRRAKSRRLVLSRRRGKGPGGRRGGRQQSSGTRQQSSGTLPSQSAFLMRQLPLPSRLAAKVRVARP